MKLALVALQLFLAITLTASAGDPKKPDAKKDLDAMQGKWAVTEMIEDGDKLDDKEIKQLSVTVQGDIITVREGKEEVAQFKMKLDPTKTPKALDLTHTKGDEKGQTEPAIYSIDGDVFKICIHDEGKTRPKAFESKDGSNHSLIVMKKK